MNNPKPGPLSRSHQIAGCIPSDWGSILVNDAHAPASLDLVVLQLGNDDAELMDRSSGKGVVVMGNDACCSNTAGEAEDPGVEHQEKLESARTGVLVLAVWREAAGVDGELTVLVFLWGLIQSKAEMLVGDR